MIVDEVPETLALRKGRFLGSMSFSQIEISPIISIIGFPTVIVAEPGHWVSEVILTV